MWTRAAGMAARVAVMAAGVALTVGVVPLPSAPAPERVLSTGIEEIDPASQSLTYHGGYWFNWLSDSTCVVPGERRCVDEPDPRCQTDVTFGPLHLVVREPRTDPSSEFSIETLPGEPVAFRCASMGVLSSPGWSRFGAACDGHRRTFALACTSNAGVDRRVAFRMTDSVRVTPSPGAMARWREATSTAWMTRGALSLAWITGVLLGSLVAFAHRRWARALGARRWVAATHRGGGVAFVVDGGTMVDGLPKELPRGAALVELANDETAEPYRAAKRTVAAARAGTWADLARDVRRLRVRGMALGLAMVALGGLPMAWLWRH